MKFKPRSKKLDEGAFGSNGAILHHYYYRPQLHEAVNESVQSPKKKRKKGDPMDEVLGKDLNHRIKEFLK